MKIDLIDSIGDSANFKWHEALWLGEAGFHVFPLNMEVYLNLMATAKVMQEIRDTVFMCPMKVTSWYRPESYNLLIGGAKKSRHIKGLACDFQVFGMDIKDAKEELKLHLEELNIRMENNGRGNWIHIDLSAPGRSGRFFKP